MATARAFTPVIVWFATLLAVAPPSVAAVPDYRIGDVAEADIVTPVPLLVLNPEATEILKQKVAGQVQLIVLQNTAVAAEVEAAMREKVAGARILFMTALRREDLDAPPYTRVIQEVVRKAPKDLPFDHLAPLWVRGQSDEPVVERMAQPLRDVLAQPVVKTRNDTPLSAAIPVRVVPVRSLTPPPVASEVENAGQIIASNRIITLWRARQLVEAAFPTADVALGRFAGSFLRDNAAPDLKLTEQIRAQRMEGVAQNDRYEPAQVIVKKGQTIDRRAFAALALMREKSLIGTLQVKLEQEQVVAGQIKYQTTWILASLGGLGFILLVVLWRQRSRPSTELSPVLIHSSLDGAAAHALPAGSEAEAWRTRALAAEGQAARAQEAIRSGFMGWMRERVMGSLFRHRQELLSAQQKAEIEIRELEQRLEELHAPLQERISAYEQRIEELEKDLAAKGEENRELIGARINVARQHLKVERERGGYSVN